MGYKEKDWLYDLYVIQKKSCVDIGIIEKKDPKTIWSWIKKYGIETRKRGADSSPGTFVKGHKKGVGRKHTEETKEKIRQARKKDGHVPYLKDGIHWLKHKNAVSPNYKGGLTPERQSFYSSIEWVDLVKQVWSRDNATCQNCGKHHNEAANRGTFHIHHIISFQIRENRSELSNLILLCDKCHRWVHSTKNINKKYIKT